MRTLHVAALPFPSAQGTQALIARMLEVLAAGGREVELVTYAHGLPRPISFAHTGAFTLRKGRSLRSGPSLEKLALDAGLAITLARRERAFRPDFVIAHHVEAAALALAVCRAPVVYFAHTWLEGELPGYVPRRLAASAARAGRSFERGLCRHAHRSLAVSPELARLLAHDVQSVTLPWSVPPAITREERQAARATFGSRPVLGYAGNLDHYQGLDVMLEGLCLAHRAGRDFDLLVATESEPSGFVARCARFGLTPRIVGLCEESQRRWLHAACDVMLVPRLTAGGLPIKLLDASARGVPVLASQRALAGLPLPVATFADDDPAAFRASLCALLAARPGGIEAREHIAREHAPSRFLASFESALANDRTDFQAAPGR